MSKESFKDFVKTKPELVDYVINKEMSWQEFYELYDLYGEDNKIWDKYTKKNSNTISDMLKNLDMDSLGENIDKVEKALNFFKEIGTNTTEDIASKVVPNVNRPITKFFGD